MERLILRNRASKDKDKGAIDLVVAAVALPILLLCLAAILDLSRVPLVKSHVSRTLRTVAQESFVPTPSATGTPAAITEPPLTTMPFINFSTEVKEHTDPTIITSNNSELEERLESLKSRIESEIAAGDDISSLINPIKPEDVTVDFTLGYLERSGSNLEFKPVLPLVSVPALIQKIGENLETKFSSPGYDLSTLGLVGGSWLLSIGNPGSREKKLIPSVWLFGTAQVRVRYLLGIFWGKEKTTTSYVVLPLKSISKIE